MLVQSNVLETSEVVALSCKQIFKGVFYDNLSKGML